MLKLKKLFKPAKKESALRSVEGVMLNEQELKIWLKNETTLKVAKLLKILRQEHLNALVDYSDNPKQDRSLIIGFCQGYDSVIDFIEKTATDPETIEENIKEILDIYLSNLNEY